MWEGLRGAATRFGEFWWRRAHAVSLISVLVTGGLEVGPSWLDQPPNEEWVPTPHSVLAGPAPTCVGSCGGCGFQARPGRGQGRNIYIYSAAAEPHSEQAHKAHQQARGTASRSLTLTLTFARSCWHQLGINITSKAGQPQPHRSTKHLCTPWPPPSLPTVPC